jgi:RNA polymerase sigma-70 factor, ECF subfamily
MAEVAIDSDAWISRTYADLVGALTFYCGDQQTAEDCAQEALIRLWQRRRQIDDPRAWVFRCAFNISVSAFRRRIAEDRAVKRAGGSGRITSQPVGPIERNLDIRSGLAKLPVRQRQAVLLRYLADFDIPQVALVMGCSPGTVKAHLARALTALRSSGLISESNDRDTADTPEESR